MDARIASGWIKRTSVTLAIAAFAAPPTQSQEDLPIRNCTWCHGSSAQGLDGAPRLAGQRAQYIERQLESFRDHCRDNPASKQYMWGATARLSSAMAQGFAHYFASLPAEPADDGDSSLVAAGKRMYEEGVPDANIVSCIVCHGPKGEGFEGIPRLGGLSYAYTKNRLEQWREGYHASARPMPLVARAMTAKEIAALASYLSFLK
jgi:cytochrome c553